MAGTDADDGREQLPAEHRWPAVASMALALVLFALVDDRLHVLPKWIVIGVVVAGFLPLIVLNPHRLTRETRWSRTLSIGIASAFALATQICVVEILVALVSGELDGLMVLANAAAIWVIQVIAFGFIFWELDRGGPVARRVEGTGDPDTAHFRFPQQEEGEDPEHRWQPGFIDYGYVALTNMVAFSPTDTMPLTHVAKLLMGWQSITGFAMLALVIARSVNILG